MNDPFNSDDKPGNVPPNDMQPNDLNPPVPPANNIAGRLKRFWAAMIDGLVGILVTFPVFSHFGIWEAIQQNKEVSHAVSNGLTLFGVVMFFVLHGFLLFKYGQTIGKRVMGLAIVTLEGSKPQFAALIINRYLPQWVVSFIPILGPMLAMGDVLFIFFNDQNRCVHDLIAKTKVIDLSIKTATATPNSIIA